MNEYVPAISKDEVERGFASGLSAVLMVRVVGAMCVVLGALVALRKRLSRTVGL